MKKVVVGLFFCITLNFVASERRKKYRKMECLQRHRVLKGKNQLFCNVYKKRSNVERGSLVEYLFLCNTLGPYTSGIPVTLEKLDEYKD